MLYCCSFTIRAQGHVRKMFESVPDNENLHLDSLTMKSDHRSKIGPPCLDPQTITILFLLSPAAIHASNEQADRWLT